MFQPDLLKNKTILITGGGTGLGKSMATRFGELGANLIISSRKQEVLDQAAEELRQTGAKVFPFSCDVRNPLEIDELLKQTKSRFDRIDALVNNAAGNFISPTENLTEKAFKVVVDIVLLGTFNMSLDVGKEMISQGRGTILNIVTTYAWTGSGKSGGTCCFPLTGCGMGKVWYPNQCYCTGSVSNRRCLETPCAARVWF